MVGSLDDLGDFLVNGLPLLGEVARRRQYDLELDSGDANDPRRSQLLLLARDLVRLDFEVMLFRKLLRRRRYLQLPARQLPSSFRRHRKQLTFEAGPHSRQRFPVENPVQFLPLVLRHVFLQDLLHALGLS